MHIKKGELLEIFLSDKETISLKKYNVINKNQTFIKEYINLIINDDLYRLDGINNQKNFNGKRKVKL